MDNLHMQNQLHRYWKSILESTLEKNRSLLSKHNVKVADDAKIKLNKIMVEGSGTTQFGPNWSSISDLSAT